MYIVKCAVFGVIFHYSLCKYLFVLIGHCGSVWNPRCEAYRVKYHLCFFFVLFCYVQCFDTIGLGIQSPCDDEVGGFEVPTSNPYRAYMPMSKRRVLVCQMRMLRIIITRDWKPRANWLTWVYLENGNSNGMCILCYSAAIRALLYWQSGSYGRVCNSGYAAWRSVIADLQEVVCQWK